MLEFGPTLAWYRFPAAEEFVIFPFMMCLMFSIGEISGWQASQFSTRTLLLFYFLHDIALVGICRWWIVFTDIGFWKYSWAHLVMSMTESWRCLRARIPRASNKGLRACPIRTEISTVSLNLLMILCTVDDVICTAFAIWHWGMLFLKYFTIFLRTLSQIGEPLPIFISFTHSDIVHSTTIHYRD